jgi:hypothetical protein
VNTPDFVSQEHLAYLDALRESGVTNMFRAAPYVADEFGIQNKEATEILIYWMKTFADRHGVKK